MLYSYYSTDAKQQDWICNKELRLLGQRFNKKFNFQISILHLPDVIPKSDNIDILLSIFMISTLKIFLKFSNYLM